ncbi:MAG: hypothetical protein ACRCUJ_00685 [Phocaeicola sp.]
MEKVLVKIMTLCFLVIHFMACSDARGEWESVSDSSLTPEGKVRIPLTLYPPSYTTVESRAIDKNESEQKIHSIGVLLFEATTDGGMVDGDRLLQTNYVDLEAIYGNQLASKAYIELEPYDKPCRVLVYTNLTAAAKNRLENGLTTLAQSSTAPTKWSDVKNFDLGLEELYVSGATPGGAATNLRAQYPMASKDTYLTEVSPATTNNLEIPLYMSFARIDLHAEALSNFSLETVTLLSGEEKGNLWYQNSRSLASNRVQSFQPTEASGGVVSPIYTYPTATPGQNEAKDAYPTELILKGEYTDAAGKTYPTSYYKVRIRYAVADETNYVVQPNRLYKVNVNAVKGPGYTTLAEAKANAPQNIEYDVTVDNSNSGATDLVISNGAYYLGVTNSEYWLYSSEATNTVVVTTLTHNAPSTVTSAWVELEGEGLTLQTTGLASVTGKKGVLLPCDGNHQEIKIEVTTDNALFPTGSIGSLNIRIGDLVKKVTLKNSGTVAGGFYILEDFKAAQVVRAEYATAATDWVSFSDESEGDYFLSTKEAPFDAPTAQLHCYLLLNNTEATRSSSIYLARNNDQGRIKVDVYQPKALPATDDVWYLPLNHYNFDAHYDFRPLVVRAKRGHSSIRLLDTDHNLIDNRSEYDWVRISNKLKYPGVGSSSLVTYLNDINHNQDKNEAGFNLSWRILYTDEHIDYSKAQGIDYRRTGSVKFCYTLYNDPRLLESDETLSFPPVYKSFDQANIVKLGKFGGSYDSKMGYTKELGVESREEHKVTLLSGGYDTSLVKMPWGVEENESTNMYDGRANSILLYNLNGEVNGDNPLPENPLDMLHNTYAAAYCLYKNRDLDGNGKIEGDEIKWYLPARGNFIGLNLAANGSTFNANLETQNGAIRGLWYPTSSKINTYGVNYYYQARFLYHYNSTITYQTYLNEAHRIRCVRDLD